MRTQKKSNVLIFQERFFLKYCEKAQKNRPQAARNTKGISYYSSSKDIFFSSK